MIRMVKSAFNADNVSEANLDKDIRARLIQVQVNVIYSMTGTVIIYIRTTPNKVSAFNSTQPSSEFFLISSR